MFYKSARVRLIVFFILNLTLLTAQNLQKVDSIRSLLPMHSGNQKLSSLSSLYEYMENALIDTQVGVLHQYRQLAKQLSLSKQISYSYMVEALAYYNNNEYDRLENFFPEALREIKETGCSDYELRCMQLEVEMYLYSSRNEHALRLNTQLRERAMELSDNAGVFYSDYLMAIIYWNMSMLDKAREYFFMLDKSVKVYIGNFPDINKNLPIDYYIQYIRFEQDNDARHALSLCDDLDAYLDKIDEYYKSINMYVNYDLYRSQVVVLRLRQYIELKEYDEVESLMKKYEDRYSGMYECIDADYFLCKAFMLARTKKYTDAVALIDSVVVYSRKNEEVQLLQESLENKSAIYEMSDDYKSALGSYRDYKLSCDSVRDAEFAVQLNELYTLHKVDTITAENRYIKKYFFFAMGMLLVVVISLVIYVIYSNKLKAANVLLYQRIEDLQRVETATEKIISNISKPEVSREMQLFTKFSELLEAEKLYLNPNLTRKDVADRLYTNDRYLVDAIKTAKEMTFLDYVNNQRVRHAIELIKIKDDTSLEEIAVSSGFTSYLSFYRFFKKKYGIPPADYKSMA